MNKWRWLCDLCRRSRSAASPPTLPVPHPVPSQGSSEPAKCFWVSLRRQYAWKSETFSSSSTSETYFLAQEKQTSIKNLKISKNCIHDYNLLWWLKISEWRTSLTWQGPWSAFGSGKEVWFSYCSSSKTDLHVAKPRYSWILILLSENLSKNIWIYFCAMQQRCVSIVLLKKLLWMS